MFIEVLKTLLKAMSVFSILIFAFGFVFYILLQNEVRALISTKQNSEKNLSKTIEENLIAFSHNMGNLKPWLDGAEISGSHPNARLDRQTHVGPQYAYCSTEVEPVLGGTEK
jgi:hypothetical protein